MLSVVKGVLESRGRRLLSLVIFGSTILYPVRARDIDLLIIVDKLSNVVEKLNLEVEISRALRTVESKTPFDVIIFDGDSFRENLEPGTLASGLIAGYRIVYDELGLEKLIEPLIEKIARGEYIVQKNGRRINLSALARARLRLLYARSGNSV